MKRDGDKRAIGIWLDCYNNLNRTGFKIHSYPDERDRNTESIDVLCEDSFGKTLGIEQHASRSISGEMTDNARFMEVLGRFEKDPNLAEVGIMTKASIEVGIIPTGISWKTLSSDLAAFLKQHVFGLGLGSHTLVFVQGSVSISLSIEKRLHLSGQPGSFLVARIGPGKSNEPTLRKAFEEKLPKLKATTADSKVLLLEQNSVAGAVSSDVAKILCVSRSARMDA